MLRCHRKGWLVFEVGQSVMTSDPVGPGEADLRSLALRPLEAEWRTGGKGCFREDPEVR